MNIIPLAFAHVEEAAAYLGSRLNPVPEVAIVLGSGLGSFAEGLAQSVTLPYETIPYWPASRIVGHAGKLVADDIVGATSELLEPFRFSRFAAGKLHPVSNSPFPWS